MTGKEILEEEFEKSGMRGYRAEQVDVFLQRVAAYVDEQEEAKNDLTYKIQILADKIEEYKKDEENIREALLGAQKLGAQMLGEARAKAEELTRETRSSSDEMLSQAKAKVDSMTRDSLQKANLDLSTVKRECDMEQRRLESLKQEVSAFRASILKQYKQHLALLSNLPTVEESEARLRSTPAVTEPERPTPAPEPERPAPELEKPAPADEPRQPEEASVASHPQTIKSDVLADEYEANIEKENREQTKEFASDRHSFHAADSEEAGEREETASSRHAARPNYIEKFGKLKFGGFGENEK